MDFFGGKIHVDIWPRGEEQGMAFAIWKRVVELCWVVCMCVCTCCVVPEWLLCRLNVRSSLLIGSPLPDKHQGSFFCVHHKVQECVCSTLSKNLLLPWNVLSSNPAISKMQGNVRVCNSCHESLTCAWPNAGHQPVTNCMLLVGSMATCYAKT